jgi:tetratricopeptide (TPR) repeat protein
MSIIADFFFTSMEKVTHALGIVEVIPKEQRTLIAKLEQAESSHEWKRCLKLAEELAEAFLDYSDPGRAQQFAEKYQAYTVKLYGSPTFESNRLMYEAAILNEHHGATIQFGLRILDQLKDKEERYNLLVQLGISYMMRAETEHVQRGDADLAYEHFGKAATLLKENTLEDAKRKRGYLFMNMGILYKNKRSYVEADTNLDRANRIATDISKLF